MDTIQILLLIVLVLSTVFLALVGIQLIIILREVRTILKTAKKAIRGFETVSTGLENGLGEVGGFLNGLKTVMRIVDLTSKKTYEK